MSEINQYQEVITAVAPLFKSNPTKISDVARGEQIKIYAIALADIDLQLLRAAVLRVMAEHIFNTVPTIGAIRTMAQQIVKEASGVADAMTAWGDLKRLLRQGYSSYRAPSETIVGAVSWRALQAIGGWVYFCASPIENEPSDRARFCQAYDNLVARETGALLELPAVAEYKSQLQSGAAQVQRSIASVTSLLSAPSRPVADVQAQVAALKARMNESTKEVVA